MLRDTYKLIHKNNLQEKQFFKIFTEVKTQCPVKFYIKKKNSQKFTKHQRPELFLNKKKAAKTETISNVLSS